MTESLDIKSNDRSAIFFNNGSKLNPLELSRENEQKKVSKDQITITDPIQEAKDGLKRFYAAEWRLHFASLGKFRDEGRKFIYPDDSNVRKLSRESFALQEMLIELGFLSSNDVQGERTPYYPEAQYGPKTAEAVVRFKKSIFNEKGIINQDVNNEFNTDVCLSILDKLYKTREVKLNQRIQQRKVLNIEDNSDDVPTTINERRDVVNPDINNREQGNRSSFLLLTGKEIDQLFINYTTPPIENGQEEKLTEPKLTLRMLKERLFLIPEAVPDYIRLNNAFKQQFGFDLMVDVSFRPKERQEYLRKLYEEGVGAPALRPGSSFHEKGMAIDFIGCGTKGHPNIFGEWLMQNAVKYNFHPVLPKNKRNFLTKYEPWHFQWEKN